RMVEEANVLDGDHRLIGKGLEKGDLRIGEQLDLGAPKLDDANSHALSHEWHAEEGPVAELPGEGHSQRELAIVDLRIRHLNRPGLENRAAADRAPAHGQNQLRCGGNGAVVGDQSQDIAFYLEHGDVVGTTEASGTLRHR